MALKNILPLHKKDENQAEHHHEKRKRANGHINQKESTKKRRQRGFTSKWRNELVAMTAEFSGTFLFLFFAFGGTQVANTAALYSDAATAGQQSNSITQAPNTSVLLYISLIFGFSLMVNVWVFFRVSGGLFNPAVSDSQCHQQSTLSLHYTYRMLMNISGHARSLPYRCSNHHPRHSLLHRADACRHVRRSCCLRYVPRRLERLDYPWRRRLHRTGYLHGDVPYLSAHYYHLHARG